MKQSSDLIYHVKFHTDFEYIIFIRHFDMLRSAAVSNTVSKVVVYVVCVLSNLFQKMQWVCVCEKLRI